MTEPLLSDVLHGACYCGKVEFQISGKCQAAGHCHCDICKGFFSSSFFTSAIFKKSGFKWTKGEDLVKLYDTGQVDRYFCSECGTRLANMPRERNIVSLPLPILRKDDNSRPNITPLGHVFYEKCITSVPDGKFKFAGMREKFLIWQTGKDYIPICISILFFLMIILLGIAIVVLSVLYPK